MHFVYSQFIEIVHFFLSFDAHRDLPGEGRDLRAWQLSELEKEASRPRLKIKETMAHLWWRTRSWRTNNGHTHPLLSLSG